MEIITDAINSIKRHSGRLDKIRLLQQYELLPGFKDLLRFIYNPYIRTGIAAAKLKRHNLCCEPYTELSLAQVIDYFTEHQTGSDADVKFALHFIACQKTDESKALATDIVTKNLRIGVTDKTLNKVYGADFIPRIGCMLGLYYKDHKGTGPYIATEKLDGVRRLLIKEKGVIKWYSRHGIEDTGLVELSKEAESLPDNIACDGELLAIGTFSDSIALRQATNSLANRKGAKTGLSYNVFDVMALDEFNAGISKYGALNRKIFLGALFGDESIQHLHKDWAKMIMSFKMESVPKLIRPVPILGIIDGDAAIEATVAPIWKRGGEGIMLNTIDGKYEIKRSKELLKVKQLLLLKLPIVGVQEGSNKNEGRLGSVLVDYKGTQVGVGSGFSDAQRVAYWELRDKLIGQTIKVATAGESKDTSGKVSLNCPIFKGGVHLA